MSEVACCIDVRADLTMLLVFEAFVALLLGLFLYAVIARHVGWEGVVVSVLMGGLVFLWWRSYSLRIVDGVLTYAAFLRAPKAIRLCDITRVTRTIEIASQPGRPPNRLEVFGLVDGREVQFDINMKVFSLADGRRIEAQIDDKA
jgi:hypothetical protein